MQPRRRGRSNFDPSKEKILGSLASNELVIDRYKSHSHLKAEILEEALLRIDSLDRDYLVEEVDCRVSTGYQKCITTTPGDEIVYAYREGRQGPTRFVINRQPEPTTLATIILARDEIKPGVMVLITAWSGQMSEPEPWDEQLVCSNEARADSVRFWQNHALAWDPSSVDFARPFGTEEEVGSYMSKL